jgi:membrane peptidoglycan carboxypeptidase
VLVLLVGTAGFGYAMTSAPLPPGEVNKQTSMVFTSDGKGTIATFAVEDRQEVKLKQIPLHVQRAVIAAEDRSFYTNNGISPKGIARAISGVVTGDDKGGGSTITQQYIKNSRKLTQERSFVRKAKEIPMALKADDTYTKDEILEFYLNTIYLGRGRYGIQAASKGYFNKDVSQLTPEEGAVLAAVIKDPTNLDPANNPTGAKERWDYVLDGMVKEGWYDKAKLATAKYPTVRPKTDGKRNAWKAGANGILAERIREEVLDIEIEGAPITEDKLDTAGLRIYTTINPRMQQAAVTAAREGMKEQDPKMGTALAAVQPGTGRILAYYGGEAGYGYNDLAGAQLPHAPGSSMKPYVLAKALEEGISLKSVWNGSSPQKFESRGDKVLRNSENDNSCKRCNLIDTTVKSLNTVYWALTEKVGAKAVRDLAAKAGITRMLGNTPEGGKPKVTPIADARVDEGIGIGQFPIPVLDQANGFATFAAYGEHATPYFVEKILDSSGDVLYQRPAKQTTRAFPEDVARDANYVMEKVVQASRTNKLDDGRKAAGKTGTQQYQDTDENAHAWMCGFTQQLAAAVWVGNKDADGPLKDKSNGGNKRVYGSGIPGRIWKAFMDAALKGQEEKDFKSPVFLGDKEVGNAPSPTPPPVVPSPTPRPTQNPDPQDSPTPDPTENPGDPDPGDPGNPDPGNPFPTPSKSRTPRPPAFP